MSLHLYFVRFFLRGGKGRVDGGKVFFHDRSDRPVLYPKKINHS